MISQWTTQSNRLNWYPRPRVPGYLSERACSIPVRMCVECVGTVFHLFQLLTTPFVWCSMRVPGRPEERSGEVHRQAERQATHLSVEVQVNFNLFVRLR